MIPLFATLALRPCDFKCGVQPSTGADANHGTTAVVRLFAENVHEVTDIAESNAEAHCFIICVIDVDAIAERPDNLVHFSITGDDWLFVGETTLVESLTLIGESVTLSLNERLESGDCVLKVLDFHLGENALIVGDVSVHTSQNCVELSDGGVSGFKALGERGSSDRRHLAGGMLNSARILPRRQFLSPTPRKNFSIEKRCAFLVDINDGCAQPDCVLTAVAIAWWSELPLGLEVPRMRATALNCAMLSGVEQSRQSIPC